MTSSVLVTGGAGYVGSHVCRGLRHAGYRVIALDDLSTGHRELAKGAELVVGDVGDEVVLRKALSGVESVVHCAAKASVEESVRLPELYRRVNVEKGAVLLREAAAAGVKRFIFSSSCAVYGNPNEVPIPEDHPVLPTHPYGETKAKFEEMLAASGMAYLCLRYFNAAGADTEGGIGELHDPESHLIPRILSGAPVTIFGTDYPTRDGTCVRDYVHVQDLASAHVLGLEHLERGPSGALNLGTGTGYSVREVIDEVRALTGRAIEVRTGPRRPGDPPSLVAKIGRASTWLNWTPRYSDLRTILRTAYEFAIRRVS